ncbi:MAG: hypothetical protein U0R44_03825 [Candidatus Micrarchaeia archaeon]
MGGDTSTKLSILSKISNLSVKYARRKQKRSSKKEWLEVKKELESVCGRLPQEDEMELLSRLMQQEVSARKNGLSDVPPPSEMTLIRKKR